MRWHSATTSLDSRSFLSQGKPPAGTRPHPGLSLDPLLRALLARHFQAQGNRRWRSAVLQALSWVPLGRCVPFSPRSVLKARSAPLCSDAQGVRETWHPGGEGLSKLAAPDSTDVVFTSEHIEQ